MLTDRDIEKLKAVFATRDDINGIRTELKGFATKDDLKNFATKDDLKDFATKDDINEIRTELKGFATKDDLKSFATKDDLKSFATKDDLKDMRADLKGDIASLSRQLNTSVEELIELISDTESALRRDVGAQIATVRAA